MSRYNGFAFLVVSLLAVWPAIASGQGAAPASSPENQAPVVGVSPPVAVVDAVPAIPVAPIAVHQAATPSFYQPESGWTCRDGLDNNGDGKVDCQELGCQGTHYCQHKMYERPLADSGKRPGLILTLGGGAALPPLLGGDLAFDSQAFGSVPYKSDIGWMGTVQLGWLPAKWVGFGLDWQAGKTRASNRYRDWGGPDNGEVKYLGDKSFKSMGPFVRLQYPFGRFVPYIDVVGGLSRSTYRLEVYDPANRFADINAWYRHPQEDRSSLQGTPEIWRDNQRQFAVYVNPGFDVFIAQQAFAIGARAVLPVYATGNLKYENTGAMLTLTFTPFWRDKPRLRRD